jgi:hypothetical protein
MTADRHSDPEKKEVATDPEELALREAENGVRQYNEIIRLFKEAKQVNDSGKRWKLRQRAILELQHAALDGISPRAGMYRNVGMRITGSDHQPPDFMEIPELIQELCDYVNGNWEQRTAVHLSAYIMWRLNWIHPFDDGNGRTARALSYLVLLAKLNTLLPGTPTIPEQIAADKGPYYDALEDADHNSIDDQPNVSSLEQLLESMLINQLMLTPHLPNSSKERLQRVFVDRLASAPSRLLEIAFGTSTPQEQLWTIGSNIVLQIAPEQGISDAKRRFDELLTPFPHLVSDEEVETATLNTVSPADSGRILADERYLVEGKYLLKMERDSYVAVRKPNLIWDRQVGGQWACQGTLYIVRLGSSITDSNIDETFDLMIAKDLDLLARGRQLDARRV